MSPSRALLEILILTAGCLVTTAVAQARSNKTIGDFFPDVVDNSRYEPKRWKTAVGGQNFTWCCIKAVQESVAVNQDGQLVAVRDAPIVDLNVTDLLKAQDEDQFPCTARYDADKPNGAPEINVPYSWFADTCPGWALSSRSNLNGWLQPLSGFLLPAVVFCLSVPRRRKIHVFREFFVADLAGIKSYVPAFFGAICAMVIVAVDTALWLSICWGLSAPMILSGLYEALLDSRVIDFVREKMKSRNLTLDMRCRLLMLVLIGNLDLGLEDDPHTAAPARGRRQPRDSVVIQGTSPSPARSLGRTRSATFDSTTRADSTSRRSITPTAGVSKSAVGRVNMDMRNEEPDNLVGIQRRPTTHLRASPWRHMEELLYPIRLYDDEDTDRNLSPRQYARRYHRHVLCQDPQCTNFSHFASEQPHARNPKVERQIRKTKTRLRAMVNCQYSFGSMVGAPVVFFLGGFVFALVQSVQEVGNEDTALALAFGQWYMTIPHIAIISGLLLAGNNPNILEGVFATQREAEAPDQVRICGLNFGLAYPSCYKVAWQWQRGHNKLRWIRTLLGTYGRGPAGGVIEDRVERDEQEDHAQDMEDLRDKTTLSPLDWFLILFMAAFLLGVPYVLAFLTAYYTPAVGLSCRSLTFSVYACAQLMQVLLWLWAYAGAPGTPARERGAGQAQAQARRGPAGLVWSGGWLDAHGFYDPRNTDHFLDGRQARGGRAVWRGLMSAGFRDVRSVWTCVWHGLYVLSGAVAGVAALGGTLMQLLGVYSANICQVSARDWPDPRAPAVTTMLSVNTKAMIDDAQIYWEPCGITAIAFMTFVSFVGWWYQRRMKDLFTNLVSEVDLDKYDRMDTKAAKRSTPGRAEMDREDPRHLWGSPAM